MRRLYIGPMPYSKKHRFSIKLLPVSCEETAHRGRRQTYTPRTHTSSWDQEAAWCSEIRPRLGKPR